MCGEGEGKAAVRVIFRITYLRRNNSILAAIRSVAFDVPDPARDKQFVRLRVQTFVGLKLLAGVRTPAHDEEIHNALDLDLDQYVAWSLNRL